MKKLKNDPALRDAIMSLAGLFDYGALMADTEPVRFIREVGQHIAQIQGERDRLLEIDRLKNTCAECGCLLERDARIPHCIYHLVSEENEERFLDAVSLLERKP